MDTPEGNSTAYRICDILPTQTASMDEPQPGLTQLLLHWSNGDSAALEQLTPLVYEELRRLAKGYLRNEKQGHTLQPTALVHEAYLRLVNQLPAVWQDRSHFYGIMARLMRQVLTDHARAAGAAKRGGGAAAVPLDEASAAVAQKSADLLALDEALRQLSGWDPRKSEIVEMRFFVGLTAEEIAELLGISAVTVRRDLRLAEAWLHRELTGSQAD